MRTLNQLYILLVIFFRSEHFPYFIGICFSHFFAFNLCINYFLHKGRVLLSASEFVNTYFVHIAHERIFWVTYDEFISKSFEMNALSIEVIEKLNYMHFDITLGDILWGRYDTPGDFWNPTHLKAFEIHEYSKHVYDDFMKLRKLHHELDLSSRYLQDWLVYFMPRHIRLEVEEILNSYDQELDPELLDLFFFKLDKPIYTYSYENLLFDIWDPYHRLWGKDYYVRMPEFSAFDPYIDYFKFELPKIPSFLSEIDFFLLTHVNVVFPGYLALIITYTIYTFYSLYLFIPEIRKLWVDEPVEKKI